MSKIKSLADQLREQMETPVPVVKSDLPIKPAAPAKPSQKVGAKLVADSGIPEILALIQSYDSSDNKSMLHVKLDAQTAKLVSHFKSATGIDNIKLGAFAVRYLFETHPELKTYIKNYLQNLDL